MTYLIRTTAEGVPTMLVEMTPARARVAGDTMMRNGGGHRPVGGAEAHRWVRAGWPHETALYIDSDNRIRRASEYRS